MDDQTVVEDILRGICDRCGAVVVLPQQSVPKIKEARARARKRTTVRIQKSLRDFIQSRLYEAGAPVQHYELAIKVVLATVLDDKPKMKGLIKKLKTLHDPVLEDPLESSVSIYLTESLQERLQDLLRRTGIAKRSELIRRLVVVTEGDKDVLRELKKVAEYVA